MNLIEAEGVSVRLGRRPVLERVDLAAPAGCVLGLIGPNGAGKTTLLRLLARLHPPDEGALRLDGRPFGEVPRRVFARSVAYLPQLAVLQWPLAVERVVALGRLPHLGPWQRPGRRDLEAIQNAMEAADIGAFATRAVTTLSDGERARAMIARALAVEPRVLLADEPVAALDPGHQLQVMALLRRHAQKGGAVVVVLHELTLAARFCDRLVMLHEGRVLAEGAPQEVLREETLEEAFHIRAHRGRFGDETFVIPWERVTTNAAAPDIDGAGK